MGRRVWAAPPQAGPPMWAAGRAGAAAPPQCSHVGAVRLVAIARITGSGGSAGHRQPPAEVEGRGRRAQGELSCFEVVSAAGMHAGASAIGRLLHGCSPTNRHAKPQAAGTSCTKGTQTLPHPAPAAHTCRSRLEVGMGRQSGVGLLVKAGPANL